MVIGVTGSFGSGKTTVAKMFARYGAYVIDADKLSHSLMRSSKKVYKKIVGCFGKGILRSNKTIDRKKLAQIVFARPLQLKFLDRVLHPEVIRRINSLIKTKKNKIVVVDAPLLVETNFYKKLDKLIVVMAKRDRQISRLIYAKDMSKDDILRRIRMQAPLKKKLAVADFIIDNSGSKTKTNLQVKKIWKILRGELCR